jgi:hypothetical protein
VAAAPPKNRHEEVNRPQAATASDGAPHTGEHHPSRLHVAPSAAAAGQRGEMPSRYGTDTIRRERGGCWDVDQARNRILRDCGGLRSRFDSEGRQRRETDDAAASVLVLEAGFLLRHEV